MNTESRDEFEAFISLPPHEKEISRFPDDGSSAWPSSYKNLIVDLAWDAWQASRQELEGEAAMWSLSFNGKPANHFTTYPTRGKAEDYISRCKIGEKEPEKVNIEVVPLYTHPASAYVPEGWKLVPETLTRAMQDAFDESPQSEDPDIEMMLSWQAMIAAAPCAPPKQEQGQ